MYKFGCRMSLLFTCSSLIAFAPHAGAATKPAQATGMVAGAPARGKAPARHHRAVHPKSAPETIGVTAHRRATGTETVVGRKLLEQAAPGANPLVAIGSLPGVSFQVQDAQGFDQWSSSLFMHGFEQGDIGMTLDDMPLGEFNHWYFNGLNPLQAVTSENVAGIDVSKSAGNESIAALNNLGGSLSYRVSDPKDKTGGQIEQGFGSYSALHTFVRLDSGRLNRTGTKFFVSYMRNDITPWRGGGKQFDQQVNMKLVQPIGSHSSVSAFYDWANMEQTAYQDESFDIINKLGYNVAGTYYNGQSSGYLMAYKAALATQGLPGGSYPAGYSQLIDPADASVYNNGIMSNDHIGYLKGDFQLTNRLKWVTLAYGHGQGVFSAWSDPYVSSPNGAAFSDYGISRKIQRFGILSRLVYDVSHHHLSAGVWYQNNHFVPSVSLYQQPLVVNGVIQGTPLSYDNRAGYSDPFELVNVQSYNSNTMTAFVEDTYHPLTNLALHFGFKSLLSTQRVGNGFINNDYYGDVGTAVTGVGLTTAAAFLPHISADWHFLKHHELFIDISENARSYEESGYAQSASPFAQTMSDYQSLRKGLNPERTWTYAIGYRYATPAISASVYAYRTNFSNRLAQITAGALQNPVSAVVNLGNVTMNGVDAELTLRAFNGVSLMNSISYNHAVYDNNITLDGQSYSIANKQIVNVPRFMYKSRLEYDWHGLSAYITASYMGPETLPTWQISRPRDTG